MLDVTVGQEQGVTIILLKGRFHFSDRDTFEATMGQTGGDKKFIIDLSGLKFLSAEGLFTLIRYAWANSKIVFIRPTTECVLGKLETTGLGEYINLQPTLESALHCYQE
jgi:anti-anti-sigma regulatory factor